MFCKEQVLRVGEISAILVPQTGRVFYLQFKALPVFYFDKSVKICIMSGTHGSLRRLSKIFWASISFRGIFLDVGVESAIRVKYKINKVFAKSGTARAGIEWLRSFGRSINSGIDLPLLRIEYEHNRGHYFLCDSYIKFSLSFAVTHIIRGYRVPAVPVSERLLYVS